MDAKTCRQGRVQVLAIAAATAGLLGAAGLPTIVADASPSIGGCPVFPANNVWNTDISSLPVLSNSATWIANMGGSSRLLHPDFGPSGGVPYGIPFNVVDSSHAKINLTFQYSGESDQVGYPFGPDTSIEGGSGAGGDRHAIMIDRGSCNLYELYDAHYNGANTSTAGSGATWNLNGNALRPATWTSADAAGLPIFPGLLRLEEVQAGVVQHAIRFTAQQTDQRFVWPARHQAGSAANPALPPMGARFRLRAGFDISHYSAATQVVLTAMKHYGMILADNGSNWFFQGAAETGWSDTMISELKSIPAGQFDGIDESSLMIDPNSAQARSAAPAPPAAKPAGRPVPAPAVPAAAAASPAANPAVTTNAATGDLPRPRTSYVMGNIATPVKTASTAMGTPLVAATVAGLELLTIGAAAWLLRGRFALV